MQMIVPMPFVRKELSDFEVVRWLVTDGETVTPGTDLCVVRVMARQTGTDDVRAGGRSRLARLRDAIANPKVAVENANVLVDLTAGEHGVVVTILEPEGSRIATGDAIARIEVGGETGDGGHFHVVANIAHASEADL